MSGNVSVGQPKFERNLPEPIARLDAINQLELGEMLINTFVVFVLEKSGEIILEWLLAIFLKWILTGKNLKLLKLKILGMYLSLLLQKNPFQEQPEQLEIDPDSEQPEE